MNKSGQTMPLSFLYAASCQLGIRSSCAAEQLHIDSSLEAVDRRAPNNSKNWQWTMEGDVSARRSTLAPHYGSTSQQTIEGSVCNGPMSTEPDNLIGTKLSFLTNHTSIYETIMVDAILVNATFQSALSNDIVT
ncbi:uncharacterized protein TNCV_2395631 [Trichonephila clavipes]|nr:uncharacterized protein TNCV_2395631 [Trichonephila clavipes]